MSLFVIGYYTLLLAVSCAGAYFNQRQVFTLAFSLTLVSFVLGIIGGAGALQAVAICAGLIALAAMVSYAFREFLILMAEGDIGAGLRNSGSVFLFCLLGFVAATILSWIFGWGLTEIFFALALLLVIIVPMNSETAKELRTAPLTAAFGMFVVFTYSIAGIFAPWIAPFGEAQVIAGAFEPANEDMLIGADQLGRDMFSRLVYGARNSVGLALTATIAAFFLGAGAGPVGGDKRRLV